MRSVIAFCLLPWAATAIASDNLVVVFDNSGSMGQTMRRARDKTRMDVAQSALIKVLSQVPDTTNVGVIIFNGWLYDLGKVDRTALETAIRGCGPGGGTPLYDFIRQGANRLLEEREKQNNIGFYKLIVVTDGEAQDSDLNSDSTFSDGSLRPGVLRDIVSRGIVVDTVALEMSDDHSLKNQINGVYMRGDDLASIEQSLQQAVAEVGYNGKDGVATEFGEIELPENFAKAVVGGLTEFRNYPIGEKPMIKVVMPDGTIQQQPDPANSTPTNSHGSIIFWACVAGIAVIAIAVICCVCSNNGY